MIAAREADLIGEMPGQDLDALKMPGHWLLARLGKRVLRPGGLEMTRRILDELAIREDDDVVEFAPGMGVTARMILAQGPRSYVGIEREEKAARWTGSRLPLVPNAAVVVGAAERTVLAVGTASVVVGEAMMTMCTRTQRELIAAEAFRLLRTGGRYAIHELAVVPDDLSDDRRRELEQALSSTIHVGARPWPVREWEALLEKAGFRVTARGRAPMHLLRPSRLLRDEGLIGALGIAKNLLLDGASRSRVLAMRRVFERYRDNLCAVYVVAQKG